MSASRNRTWAATRLSRITRVIRGRVKPQDHPELPFVGMDNIEAHTMRLLGTVPSSSMKSASVHFRSGDVLYGRLRPYLNKVHAPDFEGLASAEFIPLTPQEGVVAGFLQYRLNAADFVAYASQLDEGDRPRVDHDQIGAFEVELPPSGEQRRIVEAIEGYFTRLDAAVATLERVQRNLKRYRASVLKAAVEGRLVPTEAELACAEGRDYEPASVLLDRILAERRRRWEEAELAKMKAKGKSPKDDKWKKKYKEPVAADSVEQMPLLPGGWEWTRVDTLSWDGGYGTSRKCQPDATGPPVLRIPNVQNETLSFDDLKFATGADDLPPEGVLAPGDFVFIRTNGSKSLIGRGALVLKPLSREYYFASYLIRLRLASSSTAARWFALTWHVPVVRNQLLRDAASSAGQHNVSLSAARSYLMPLPPLAEQQRILAEVERVLSIIDSVYNIVRSSIARAASLRQSILKWAFEGRLVDQDPTDEPASALLERIRAERASSASKPKRTTRRNTRSRTA
jgi:type I restriction enzyme, S subunit